MIRSALRTWRLLGEAFAGAGRAAFGTCLLAAAPNAAAAAEGLWTLCLGTLPAVRPGQVWQAWSLAPAIVLPLAAFALLYGIGWVKSRSGAATAPMSGWEGACAAAGMMLLVVALVSPLCRVSANLAWIHMVQHLLIVALAPPLILLGSPGRALHLAFGVRVALPARSPALPPESGRDGHQLIAAFAYGTAIWLWHIPWFYEAALASASIHLVFVASLLLVSFWFWREVIAAPAGGLGTTAFVLLATLIHTGMLGALLTFSHRIWYPAMTPGALLWGLHPLEDQQLAGLIMWIPMGAVYLIAGLLAVSALLGDDNQQTIRPNAVSRME